MAAPRGNRAASHDAAHSAPDERADAAAPESPRPGAWTRTLSVCAGLMLMVTLVFGQTAGFDFVNYDDNAYVYENAHVQRGLTAAGLAHVFTHRDAGNWHPLTWMSHMLDYQLFGPSAGGHHVSSVLLHAAAAIVLFLALQRLTDAFWPSALRRSLVRRSPAARESVAWVAERKDVLSGLFFMLTLLAYARYARQPYSSPSYLWVFLSLALGLMAKPMLVTVPLVLLLIDAWPLQRFNRVRSSWLILEKIPLGLLALAASAVTLWAQADAIEVAREPSSWSRFANIPVAYISYLFELFCPLGLAVHYPYAPETLPWWRVAGCTLLLVAISGGAWRLRRPAPWLWVGWCWFLIMLIPVIGVVRVGTQAIADRYTYLPHIGLLIAAVWSAAHVAAERRWQPTALGVAAAFLLTATMAAAWQQTSYWHDSVSLWNRAIDVASPNARAHKNLSLVLAGQHEIDESIAHCRAALQIDPGDVESLNNLGNALEAQGKFDAAIDAYRQAIAVQSNVALAHYNLANALRQAGRGDEAVAEYQQAISLQPDYVSAHNNLGSLLLAQGKLEPAIACYDRALSANPRSTQTLFNLAAVLAESGRTREAEAHLRDILQIDPHSDQAWCQLGVLRFRQHDQPGALEALRHALTLNPENLTARFRLALTLRAGGQIAAAISQWRDLLLRQSDEINSLYQLSWLLATGPDAALRDGRAAVELASRGCRLVNDRDAALLDALAAAYAETGDFSRAAAAIERCLATAGRKRMPS